MEYATRLLKMEDWAVGAANSLEARIRIQADLDKLEKRCREEKEGQSSRIKQSTEHIQDGE